MDDSDDEELTYESDDIGGMVDDSDDEEVMGERDDPLMVAESKMKDYSRMVLELEVSCQELVQQGSTGVIAAIDHMTWLLSFVEKEGLEGRVSTEKLACVFMNMQKGIIMEIISSSAVDGYQTALIKLLDMLSLVWKDSYQFQCFLFCCQSPTTNGNCYLSTDVANQVVDLWAKTSDQVILDKFVFLFRFMWNCGPFVKFTLFPECAAYRPVASAADARRYMQLLMAYKLSGEDQVINAVFAFHALRVPNFLPTLIKSTTYLVNCWRLLHSTDAFLASTFIRDKILKVLDLMRYVMRHRFIYEPMRLFSAGFGRLFRCVTLAAVQTTNCLQATIYFRMFLMEAVGFPTFHSEFVFGGNIGNIYSLMSREEINVLLDCFIDGPESSAVQDHITMAELEKVIQIEDSLSPLCRSDADILYLPGYVSEAIGTLGRDATFTPNVGVSSLTDVNVELLPSFRTTRNIPTELRERISQL